MHACMHACIHIHLYMFWTLALKKCVHRWKLLRGLWQRCSPALLQKWKQMSQWRWAFWIWIARNLDSWAFVEVVPSLLRTTCGKSTKITARRDHSHNELKIAAEYFKIIIAVRASWVYSTCLEKSDNGLLFRGAVAVWVPGWLAGRHAQEGQEQKTMHLFRQMWGTTLHAEVADLVAPDAKDLGITMPEDLEITWSYVCDVFVKSTRQEDLDRRTWVLPAWFQRLMECNGWRSRCPAGQLPGEKHSGVLYWTLAASYTHTYIYIYTVTHTHTYIHIYMIYYIVCIYIYTRICEM